MKLKYIIALLSYVCSYTTLLAQFSNGQFEIENNVSHFADSILKNQKVLCTPLQVKEILQSDKVPTHYLVPLVNYTAKDKDSKTIYREAKPAVAWLGMCTRNSALRPIFINPASAFVISPDGICMTNYHVILAFANSMGIDSSGVMALRLGNGKIYQLKKILALSPSNDIAVIQLAISPKEQLPFLPIAKSIPEVGEDAYVLGSPQGLYFSFTKGIVSSLYNEQKMWPNNRGTSFRNLMAITAEFAVGASGSPILNHCGQAIGMVSSTSSIPQNVNGLTMTQMVIKNAIPNASLLSILTK